MNIRASLFVAGALISSHVWAQGPFAVSFDGTPLGLETARHSAYPHNQVWPGYERPISQSKEDVFVRFDLVRAGRVTVDLPKGCAAADVKLRPYGFSGLRVEGEKASFEIAKPGQFVMEFGQDRPQLHVFADAPFVHAPVPDEIYFGPGEHDAGLICPTNGQTVCLDRGAVVYGALLLENVTNVTVTGRGILDSSRIRRKSPDGRYLRTLSTEDRATLTDVTQFMCVGSENVRVEGIVLRDSPFWTMVFRAGCRKILIDGVKIVGQWRYNSDGIDLCGCQDVRVRNCFIRSFDDCFVVRDGGRGANGRPQDSRNIRCENTMMWCDWGSNVKAQLTGSPRALIENVIVTKCVFANVDTGGVILAARPGGVNGIVRDIRIEDIEYDFSACRYSHQLQRRDCPDEAFVKRPVQVAKLIDICNYGFRPSDVANIELLFDRIALRRVKALGPYSYLKADVRLTAGRERVRGLVVEDVPERVVWTKKATIEDAPVPTWVNPGNLVLNDGNAARLNAVFAKATRGERIVIGALGGSITEGAGAQGGVRWANIVCDWFRKRFPDAQVEMRNAGIGSTGSLIGALRLRRDLREGLDFVTVDYSVNDKPNEPCEATMEGCVSQLLADKGRPAVVLVAFGASDGRSEQMRHLSVARHYGLPMLSVRNCVWPAIKSGEVPWSEWSADNVHPNVQGHRIAGTLVCGWLDRTYEQWRTRKQPLCDNLPKKPLVGRDYENGRIFEPSSLKIVRNDGFVRETVGKRWKGGLVADKPGARVVFELDGGVLSLLHWRQRGRYGRARVSVDGQEVDVLEGWFDKTWGGYAHPTTIWKGVGGRHRVEIEVLADHAAEATGTRFEICAVGVSGPRFASDEDYLRRKFREDVTDSSTGIGLVQLKAEAVRKADELKGREPWCLVKAHLFESICDRMSIGVSRHDYFPAVAVWSRKDRVLSPVLAARIDEVQKRDCEAARRSLTRVPKSCIRLDYDHATPDWDSALQLGFTGLRARLLRIEEKNDFHRAMLIATDAMLRHVRRLADYAKACPDADDPRVKAEAEALDHLCRGAPRTSYEAMLFQWLFFIYGEHVDHLQVRTLGNWDRLMGPYYERDLANGVLTRESFKELVKHFWWQWGSINNWWGQPVYIGGTKANGETEYNEVSRIVLEVQDELALPTPKLQMKIADNTPDDIFRKGLDLARKTRSVVFCGERSMEAGLLAMGCTSEEARNCELWGCYEYQPRALANTTLPCMLNVVDPICALLENSRKGSFAPTTFEAFVEAYRASLRYRSGIAMDAVRAFERPMDEMIPALVHSLTLESCVKNGKNAIGDGMKYNYSMFLPVGAGTAADSLAAIKELVYERKELSLRELAELMSKNWEGRDDLRLRMKASHRKWGNNDPLTKELFNDIYATIGKCVNGQPNSRRGTFVVGGHSIDFFKILGRVTTASPDGRRFGDELSKNISPAPGADKEGATALVDSIAGIDFAQLPGDTAFDIMLHPSTAAGEKGLDLMQALVSVYFDNGGRAVHFNVVAPETLREAQRSPEKYSNLQIRVCGWNVFWNSLSKAEQDAYIVRAESILK